MSDLSRQIHENPAVREALSRVFGELSDAAFTVIAADTQSQLLPGGQVLFEQGDPGDSLYVLLHGRLRVNARDPETGAVEPLGEVLPGQTVGEVGLLTGEARTATVHAARDSMLVKIGREAFDHMVETNPDLLRSLARVIVDRARQNTQRRRFSPTVSNIAILPADTHSSTQTSTAAFTSALVEALSAYASTNHLDAARVASELGEQAASGDRGADARIGEWLQAQEAGCRFLIYQADAAHPAWTRRCLRQADVVVTVARAAATPGRGLPAWDDPAVGPSVSRVRHILVLERQDDQPRSTDRWLDKLRVDEHYHARRDRPQDIQRIARILAGQGTGLVLGGGGARGFAHVGIYRALVERGIHVDWVGGTSIGSVFAAGIAMGWDPDELEVNAREAFLKGRPMSGYTLPLVSLMSPRRLERGVRKLFACNIEDLPLPFFCASTNLSEARLEMHERGPLWHALRCSTALPGVFPPAVAGNDLVIDGALLNNLPADVMAERPVGKVIAVSLSVPKEYRLDYDVFPGPWEILASRLPLRERLRVPGILTLMLKATEVDSLVHTRQTSAGADLVLTPPVRRFGLLDASRFDDLVKLGYEYACERLDQPDAMALQTRTN
jgi:predicted acylesterase/phospholipase RssA/CRP-like cAMP-binding protein